MQGMTERICRYVADLTYEQLDAATVEQVKLFIADYYAACLAGYRINKQLNDATLQLMQTMGGTPESTVLFSQQKLPASNAAFMNAIYAHGADMDDGNRKSAGHIAVHVMSAVFAVAETVKASWRDVITAIVVGYDVFNRVAGAAQPSLYNKGFHSTGIGGAPACAAACAKLLNLGYEGIYNAVSLAAIQSSGLIIIDESGQGCKPINPANAARTGVVSAQLAQLGVESSRNPLESKKGWFNAFSDSIDEGTLFDGLGETFTICESYLKLYPSCRHTHCAIDAAIALRERMNADGCGVADIDKIVVTVYPSAIKSTGNIPYPATTDEAKFSIHYCLATALIKGCFGLDELDVAANDAYRPLVSKIELIAEPTLENRAAGIRGAKVCIQTGNGMYEETVLIPKGEASQPLTWTDITRKFGECAGALCTAATVNDSITALRDINSDSPFTMLRF